MASTFKYVAKELPLGKALKSVSDPCAKGYEEMNSDLIDAVFLNILVNSIYPGQWGDYGTCVSDLGGQYILATIKGNFNGNYVFSRAVEGKYLNNGEGMTSIIGICMPKVCSYNDAKTFDATIIPMMEGLKWSDVSVSYTMSSNFKESGISEAVPIGWNTFTWLTLLFFVLLGGAGAIFELTKIGDV